MAFATPISAGYSAPRLCRCDGQIVCRSGCLKRTPFASPNPAAARVVVLPS
jgi:hypothetical protein